ncbi:MAG: hypothetical protein K8E66_06325 [Phycisphaerales bacterium]|nr:hypothetical protein [Phycisphaerales bacterium]
MTRAGAQNVRDPGHAWTPPRQAAVRWRIGAAAARPLFRTTGRTIQIELRLRDTGDEWRAEVWLDTGEEIRCVLRETGVTVRWTPDTGRGLVHIDADPFLHATIDVSGGTAALVYASTPVLGTLGLCGGRYEVEGAELKR